MVTDKRHRGATWDDFIQNCVLNKTQIRKREETSPLRYDPKFIDICKSIAHTPKYQYQLMQNVLQIDPDVLIAAQKAGLNRHQKLLLTKSKLRGYSSIQKNLIPKLKKLSIEQGTVLVNQKLRDIETGYIEPSPSGSGEFVYSEKPADQREKVQAGNTNKILDLPTAIEFDIVRETNKVIFLLTGRALTSNEYCYTKKSY